MDAIWKGHRKVTVKEPKRPEKVMDLMEILRKSVRGPGSRVMVRRASARRARAA